MPSSARRAMPQRRPTPIMAAGVATVAVAMADAGMAAIAPRPAIAKAAIVPRAVIVMAGIAPRVGIVPRPSVRLKVGIVKAEIAGMANSVAAAVRAAGARASGPTTKAGAPANQRAS